MISDRVPFSMAYQLPECGGRQISDNNSCEEYNGANVGQLWQEESRLYVVLPRDEAAWIIA